ncbi:unnamed protein product [Larinioides sclopetarius]|uniref:Secreted protein n=1 Tax=Larinioides sclopetarius TaxID=280406 RepID=A0AAV2A008_9ARAC
MSIFLVGRLFLLQCSNWNVCFFGSFFFISAREPSNISQSTRMRRHSKNYEDYRISVDIQYSEDGGRPFPEVRFFFILVFDFCRLVL